MSIKIIPAITATHSVREYQKLVALVDRRIAENSSIESMQFWNSFQHQRALEIATEAGITIFQLVDSWIEWTESVDAARADYMAKVGA